MLASGPAWRSIPVAGFSSFIERSCEVRRELRFVMKTFQARILERKSLDLFRTALMLAILFELLLRSPYATGLRLQGHSAWWLAGPAAAAFAFASASLRATNTVPS